MCPDSSVTRLSGSTDPLGYLTAGDRAVVEPEARLIRLALVNETNWQTLLEDYQAAVGKFENVSAALGRALARYPAGAEFLELIVLEQRLRETVLLSRRRLIEFWHDSLDDTIPVRVVKPDHTCDSDGPTETVVDETGAEATSGIYPTCSICGVPQLLPLGQAGR